MALKVKNPKKNLADILIEKERLNESYDSSSAVSLKTLEETAEGDSSVNQVESKSDNSSEKANSTNNRPKESIVNEQILQPDTIQNPIPAPINQPNDPALTSAQQPIVQKRIQQPTIQQHQQIPQYQQTQAYNPPLQEDAIYRPAPMQDRKPWEEAEEYNPPRRKRGRPYQGYAENTHVQSIYVRNDLYEYIMINYVGHGRKHSSFNKFVNAAINNYLRQLDEER